MFSWFRHAHPVCFFAFGSLVFLVLFPCRLSFTDSPRFIALGQIHFLSGLWFTKPFTCRCFVRTLSLFGTETTSLVLSCSHSFWAIRSRLTLSQSSSSFPLTFFLSALTHFCASSRGNTDRSSLSPSHSVSSVCRLSLSDLRSLDETGIIRAVIQSLYMVRYTSGLG